MPEQEEISDVVSYQNGARLLRPLLRPEFSQPAEQPGSPGAMPAGTSNRARYHGFARGKDFASRGSEVS